MSKKKKEKPAPAPAPTSRADLEREIARLEAINRDLRQRDARARLSRLAKENERLRKSADLPPRLREITPSIALHARARTAQEELDAARERVENADLRAEVLRSRVESGDASTSTIATLAHVNAELRDARIALEWAEAHALRTAPEVRLVRGERGEGEAGRDARVADLRAAGYR